MSNFSLQNYDQLKQLVRLSAKPDPENYSVQLGQLQALWSHLEDPQALIDKWEAEYPELLIPVCSFKDLDKFEEGPIKQERRRIFLAENPWLKCKAQTEADPLPAELTYHIGTPEFEEELYQGPPYSLKIQCLLNVPGGAEAIRKHYGLASVNTVIADYASAYFTLESHEYALENLDLLAARSGRYEDMIRLRESNDSYIYRELARFGDENLIMRFYSDTGRQIKPIWILRGAAEGCHVGLYLKYLEILRTSGKGPGYINSCIVRSASDAVWSQKITMVAVAINFCSQHNLVFKPEYGQSYLCRQIGEHLDVGVIRKVDFGGSDIVDMLAGAILSGRTDVLEEYKSEILTLSNQQRDLSDIFVVALQRSYLPILEIYLEKKLDLLSHFPTLCPSLVKCDDRSCQGVKLILDRVEIDVRAYADMLSGLLERNLIARNHKLFITLLTHPKLSQYTQNIWENSDHIHQSYTGAYIILKKLILDHRLHSLSPKYEELVAAIKHPSPNMVGVLVNHMLRLGRNIPEKHLQTLCRLAQSKVNIARRVTASGNPMFMSVDLGKTERVLSHVERLSALAL